MGMTDQHKPAMKGGDAGALAYTIEGAVSASGLGRSTIYDLVSRGLLDARKAGKRTLITGESLKKYLTSLPSAQIGKGAA